MRYLAISFLLLCASVRADIAVEIDLSAQQAWILQDGQRIYETPISSGRADFPTPTGNFTVTEKDKNHRSSLYGRIVDTEGRTVVADASSAMAVPEGGKFVPSPMKNFIRFDGATGMHIGPLPGYPASHGCVRLPAHRSALFFNIVQVGTPVRVFGQAPYRAVAKSATPAPAVAAPAKKSWFPWIRRIKS